MNPRVTEVHPLADHVLLVTFASGETRQLDIRPYLAHAVFDRLREWSFFERVRADHGTLAWPEGIDLDPDSVYLDSVPLVQVTAA